jgi:hypothetical protein
MRAIEARERAMAKIGWRILAVSGLIASATPLSAGQFRTVGPGGIAMGAVIGVPLGGPYYHPGYAPIVGYEPFSFDAPFPVPCPAGYWAHRPLVDRWGHQFGYSAPRFFCP